MNLGSSIDDFLKKEKIFDEVQAQARCPRFAPLPLGANLARSILDTLSYNESIATINCKPAATRPPSRGSRTCTAWRSVRNSLKNKYLTSNPLNLKVDLAELTL